jgi:hypothetical protein
LQPEIIATDSSMADRVVQAVTPSLILTDVLLVKSFESDPGRPAGEQQVLQRRRIIVDAPALRNGLLRISPIHPYALIGSTWRDRSPSVLFASSQTRHNADPRRSYPT